MSTQLRIAIAVTSILVPGAAVAQHELHAAGASQASEMAQCARIQPVVNNVIAAAMARLESARQSNSPADMRAAIDHLEAALRDIRAQLAPCSVAMGATEPHAGHTMPAPPASPENPPAPKPAPSKPERPQTADPHAVQVSGELAEKQMDPVNGLMVDPSSAKKTSYQGQTYYFSSEQTLKAFLQNPGRFAKKPKG